MIFFSSLFKSSENSNSEVSETPKKSFNWKQLPTFRKAPSFDKFNSKAHDIQDNAQALQSPLTVQCQVDYNTFQVHHALHFGTSHQHVRLPQYSFNTAIVKDNWNVRARASSEQVHTLLSVQKYGFLANISLMLATRGFNLDASLSHRMKNSAFQVKLMSLSGLGLNFSTPLSDRLSFGSELTLMPENMHGDLSINQTYTLQHEIPKTSTSFFSYSSKIGRSIINTFQASHTKTIRPGINVSASTYLSHSDRGSWKVASSLGYNQQLPNLEMCHISANASTDLKVSASVSLPLTPMCAVEFIARSDFIKKDCEYGINLNMGL